MNTISGLLSFLLVFGLSLSAIAKPEDITNKVMKAECHGYGTGPFRLTFEPKLRGQGMQMTKTPTAIINGVRPRTYDIDRFLFDRATNRYVTYAIDGPNFISVEFYFSGNGQVTFANGAVVNLTRCAIRKIP